MKARLMEREQKERERKSEDIDEENSQKNKMIAASLAEKDDGTRGQSADATKSQVEEKKRQRRKDNADNLSMEKQTRKKPNMEAEDAKVWLQRTKGRENNVNELVRQIMVTGDRSTSYKICQFAMSTDPEKSKCLFILCSECVEPYYIENSTKRRIEASQPYKECDHDKCSLHMASDFKSCFSYAFLYDREEDGGEVATRCFRCNGRICVDYR